MASLAALPRGDDTELNMTPMIDVVFQLILFFLLTLKFKSIDQRIDASLPRNVGPVPSPAVPMDVQHIQVSLFRKDREDREKAFTRLRIGNDTTIDLPKGPWPESGRDDADHLRAYDQRFQWVAASIRAAWDAQGRDPAIRGKIKAAPPDGPSVPSADVIRVLDAFLEVGLTGVDFVGTQAPLPSSEGGRMFR